MVLQQHPHSKGSPEHTAPHVQRFIDFYQQLDKNNLDKLPDIYHSDISFTDPLHHIQGLSELRQYFANMYDGVIHIDFDIQRRIIGDHQASLEWCMHYQHRKLKQGQTIDVHGISWLIFAEDSDKQWRVISHRDYFDAGQMLYEHLPLLGRTIRYLKRRIAP